MDYPKEARRKGIDKGHVVAHLYIDEKGNVSEVKIIEANPPRVFDRDVIDWLRQWRFQGEGEKYIGEVEFTFKLE